MSSFLGLVGHFQPYDGLAGLIMQINSVGTCALQIPYSKKYANKTLKFIFT